MCVCVCALRMVLPEKILSRANNSMINATALLFFKNIFLTLFCRTVPEAHPLPFPAQAGQESKESKDGRVRVCDHFMDYCDPHEPHQVLS